MNTAYTFTPEGQVDITVSMFSKGAQRATFELVTKNKDGKNPADLLRNVVMELRSQVKKLKKVGYTINEEMGAPDVFGKASSVSGLLGLDGPSLKKIEKFITKMRSKSMNAESKKSWDSLGEGWTAAQNAVKSHHKQMEDTLLKEIEAACKPLGATDENGKKIFVYHDPYLVPMTKTLPKKFPKIGKNIVDIGYTTHISFAKLILQMVAKPILATGQFHDVQLLFYPMNEFAMFGKDLNVGQYPINKGKLKDKLFKQMKKTPSITIQKLLNMIKKTFVNFTGDDIYGMSKVYKEKKDEEGKYEIMKSYSDDEKGKQKFAILKSEILAAAYPGVDTEKRFKKPSIQMFVECVQHEENPKLSILRLHFFDKACTSYSSYAQLWSASSGSDLGIIGKYANAKKSVDNVEKKLAKAPKKERKKLLELKANRKARLNRHGKHAKRQMEQFEKNGLIKPIKVGKQDGKDVIKYQIAGGPDQLRGILAANMPTLKYGTEFSGILNASLQTNSNPQMETIHMQRQGAGGGTDDGFDAGLPMTVKPVTLSIDTFGCPYVNFGQQFFVDFQTNTTIDDIYAVSGVQHSLSPTEFKSSIKLTPLNKMGQYRNVQDQFDDAVGAAAAVAVAMVKSMPASPLR